ncbi:trypsin-like peptidase domain-containing protein [Streptomyces sp. ST1020]|uniref:serine protease n=1 Tax=Streptomyces sp. ST1020 TaxID=1848901 RepID=UPI0034C6B096
MDEARVVEIWNPAGGRTGSGYLLGDDLVLTSCHVLDGTPAGGAVEVRQLDALGRTRWLPADVVWLPSPTDADADAALLRVTDDRWHPPPGPPVRFGRVVGRDRVPCLGLGFPGAARRSAYERDTMPVRGHVDPLHGMKSGLLTVHVDTGIAPAREGWRGASGAALLCGPRLVAVVRAEKAVAPGVLDAVPVTALAELPGFRQTLETYGVRLVVEDVGGAAPERPSLVPVGVSPPPWRHRLRDVPLPALGGALTFLLFARLGPRSAGVAWTIGSFFAGVVAMWSIARLRSPHRASGGLDAMRVRLSEAVLGEVARRRRQLLGDDSKAINVAFTTVLQGGRDAERAWSGGDFARVAEYLEALVPRRLVVTGGPGAGKTLLAYELVHRLLSRMDGGGPVPVPMSLPGWDTTVPFTDWFTGRLAHDYLDGSDTAARRLLATGRIMPVLDGLDELDPPGGGRSRAAAALVQLNRFEGPLAVTCRSTEYEALSRAGERLLDCATVRIEAVGAADGRRYLVERAVDRARLHAVEEELFTAGTATAAALSSPWMLTLASLVSRSEAGALRLASFTGVADSPAARREVRAALLEALIPTVCAADPEQRYTARDVERWLRALAAGLGRGDTGRLGQGGTGRLRALATGQGSVSVRDFEIHSLWPVAGPRAARYAAVAVTLACWLPALALLALGFQVNGAFPLPGALLLGLLAPALAVAAWEARAPHAQPRRMVFRRLRGRLGWSRVALGTVLGGVLMLPLAPLFGPGFALAGGGAFAGVFGFGLALSVRADVDRGRLLAAAAPTALAVLSLAGALAGRFGDFTGLAAGCGAGAIGLVAGVRAGLRAARRKGGGDPDPDPPGVPTPLSPLRNDALAGLAAGAVTGGVALYALLFVDWLRMPWPLAAVTAVACGLAAGPGFVAITTRQYAGVVAATRGRLPWRLAGFLRWCHDRGLLRSAGTAYQLRHDELLVWLQGDGVPRA